MAKDGEISLDQIADTKDKGKRLIKSIYSFVVAGNEAIKQVETAARKKL